MQLAWFAVAGAALAWLYLAAFDSLLCGGRAARMSLLPAIGWFIAGTTLLLACMWALAEGRFERFTAALAGFAVARALLDRPTEADGESERSEVRRRVREILGEQPLDRLA